MRVRNQTTVVLTEKAQKVKDNLAPVFGLKNVLSAGLLLFSRLSAEEQKVMISEAVGQLDSTDSTIHLQKIQRTLALISQPGYKTLSKEEAEALVRLSRMISSKVSSKNKSKKGA